MPVCEFCQSSQELRQYYREGSFAAHYICSECLRIDRQNICCVCCRLTPYGRVLYDSAGQGYCEDCFESEVAFCVFCNRSCLSELMHYNEYDEPVCSSCHNPGPVFDYTYKPKFKFYHEVGEKTKLYYGIELEVELPNRGDPIPQLHKFLTKNFQDQFYLKHDGSLNCGVEIVSHPMTMNYMRTSNQWNEILKYCTTKNYDSDFTNTCGMHVHMSLSVFSSTQLYKLMNFMGENKSFILHLTQREESKLDRWAYMDTKHIAHRKAIRKSQAGEDRHSAINLSTGTTVEIRIFRGTLNEVMFWRNLEICESLYEFTRDTGLNSLSAKDYVNFVLHNKKWPRLSAFLKGENYVPNHCKKTEWTSNEKRTQAGVPVQ